MPIQSIGSQPAAVASPHSSSWSLWSCLKKVAVFALVYFAKPSQALATHGEPLGLVVPGVQGKWSCQTVEGSAGEIVQALKLVDTRSLEQCEFMDLLKQGKTQLAKKYCEDRPWLDLASIERHLLENSDPNDSEGLDKPVWQATLDAVLEKEVVVTHHNIYATPGSLAYLLHEKETELYKLDPNTWEGQQCPDGVPALHREVLVEFQRALDQGDEALATEFYTLFPWLESFLPSIEKKLADHDPNNSEGGTHPNLIVGHLRTLTPSSTTAIPFCAVLG